MATRTFTSAGVNNLWTNPANWDAAPVDDDTVIIPFGQTCEFDADMSDAGTWPNGIAGITITGTLSHTLTSGTYHLKIKSAGAISGAGTYNIGSQGNAIPFAAKHTITGGANWSVQAAGGLTMNVYAAEPVTKYALLSDAENIGATRLEIDTDLTSDIWAVTDTIHINNINKAMQSESRVISAITATYIDVTVGLTAAKLAGSYVCLITRNVKIISVGTTTPTLQNFASGKLTIAGGAFIGASYRALRDCKKATISGGTFSGHLYAAIGCHDIQTTGGVFSGNTVGYIAAKGAYISGGLFSGLVSLCDTTDGAVISGGVFSSINQCFGYCSSISISGGVFIGIGTIVNYCSDYVNISGGFFSNFTNVFYRTSIKLTGATFSNNTYDIRAVTGSLYNQALTSAVEHFEYVFLSPTHYLESINHNNTAGAFKAWTKGGITTSVASPAPNGFTRSYQLALEESSGIKGFWQREVLVPAGAKLIITMHLQKSVSMSYKPRCWIFLEGIDPLLGGSVLNEFIYPDDTNNAWAASAYAYTNSDDYDKKLVVRFLGMNATGSVFGQVQFYIPPAPPVMLPTIFEQVTQALGQLDPEIPFAMGQYLTANGAPLPDTFMVYQEITGNPEQHADDAETARTYRIQVSIYARGGLVTLPLVDAAMIAQGFTKGPERQLPYDKETRHFGLAKDYFYLDG